MRIKQDNKKAVELQSKIDQIEDKKLRKDAVAAIAFSFGAVAVSALGVIFILAFCIAAATLPKRIFMARGI